MMLQAIKDTISKYGYYHTMVWIIHAAAILSLIVFPIEYFIYGVIFYLLAGPILHLTSHEYISHQSIAPRNRWIDLFVLLVFYANGFNIRHKKAFHVTHHVHWQEPDQDPTQRRISAAGNTWRYVFNLVQPEVLNLRPVRDLLSERNHWVQILEPHARKITWIYRIALFMLLPIEWFAVFVVWFSWLNMLTWSLNDVAFHGPNPTRDRSWYVFFWGCNAWHVYHHNNPHDVYFGPGPWRWLNLQWYYYLLLFRKETNPLAWQS